MLRIGERLLLFAVVSESILGSLGNGFIGIVYCIDCVKKKKFSMIGFILTGLAISRFFLIWLIITDGFMKIFSSDLYILSHLIYYVSYLWIVTNQLSIWFATSLSVFYLLKIAHFSHHIFLWLKKRINRVLLLLMGFLLISWMLIFPNVVRIINKRTENKSTVSYIHNSNTEFFIHQILFNLGAIVLFALTLMNCVFLIVSLWRHHKQMQANFTGSKDPSTRAHMKAMKIVLSFIILFVLYFIGIVIEIICSTMPENQLLFMFGMTTAVLYPCGHSFILILGNNQLKKASESVLQQFKCLRRNLTECHGQV
ncbi:taste receptor type 2 member 10 [Suncus etruscus]|uniref:taste receptor type 2 member 10 n=1 Tax=Suncus etruscus TaxID=109475 RepID=UPI0021107EF2|nr:taste receptor type 2 member 10 [Suncus etruscus]